jgi:hypothetical protein
MRSPIILLILLVSLLPPLSAQAAPEQAPTPGTVPVNAELLDKMEKFAKSVANDPAARAEWIKSDTDPDMVDPERATAVVSKKYPKLEAAFKAAGLTPSDFLKALGTLIETGLMAEMNVPAEDKVKQANITFYKANKERVDALSDAIKNLSES